MERTWQQENKQEMKYEENLKKRISGNKAHYVKQEENDGKLRNLMELGN